MSEELKNKILNNIEELSHIEDKDETRFRLDCLEELFQDYSSTDLLSCPSITTEQVLLLLILLYSDDFKEIPYDDDDFDVRYSNLSFLEHSDKYVTKLFRVLHYMHDNQLIFSFLDVAGYDPSDLAKKLDFKKAIKFLFKSLKDFTLVVDLNYLLKEDADDFISACYLFKDLRDWSLLDPYFCCRNIYDEVEDKLDYNEAVEIVQKFHHLFEPLYQSYLEEERKWRKNNKANKKQLGNYQTFLAKTDLAFKKKEIENFEELVSLLPASNEELKKEFLLEVFHHNQKAYQDLEKEYQYLTEHDLSRYITLFHNYSLSFSEIPPTIQKEIQNLSYDECSRRLTLIIEMKLTNIKVISYYLIHCDCSKLKEINKWLDTYILTSDLLINFYDKLIQDDEYEKVKTNIQTLLDYHIQVGKFHHQFDLLFLDPNLFAENLKILDEYGCKIKSRTVKDFSMLCDQDLTEKIDSFMEAGLGDLVINHSEILNIDGNLVNRIYICRKLDFPIFDQETGLLREEILDKNLFFVPDIDIHQYGNFVPVDLATVDETKLVDQSPSVYRYEESLISKKRWERYQKQLVKQK